MEWLCDFFSGEGWLSRFPQVQWCQTDPVKGRCSGRFSFQPSMFLLGWNENQQPQRPITGSVSVSGKTCQATLGRLENSKEIAKTAQLALNTNICNSIRNLSYKWNLTGDTGTVVTSSITNHVLISCELAWLLVWHLLAISIFSLNNRDSNNTCLNS